MTDLLPPSPSAAPPQRASPSPSPLGSSTPADVAQLSPRVLPFTNPAASSSSTSLNSLSSLQGYTFGNDTSTPASAQGSHLRSYSYGALHASFTSPPTDPLMGPEIRPLDFGTVMESHEATHLELQRTVEGLTQWLSVVEVGLSQLLDKAAEHTIEEEQEQEDTPSLSNGTMGTHALSMLKSDTPVPTPALAAES